MNNISFTLVLICFLSFLKTHANNNDIGALVPWTTYEAEDALYNGNKLSGHYDRTKEAYEASGKTVVELSSPGHYVQFNSTVSANRLTIRYSIPKGSEGSILYKLNGDLQSEVPLNSSRIWRDETRLPANHFRFFDEIIIETEINSGDIITLEMHAEGQLQRCLIDFIDLELAPEPLGKPDETWVDITEFGATGDDESDDTQSIKNAIASANSGSKKVWIPAGIFNVNSEIVIPNGITIAGAGMWHSVLRNNVTSSNPQRGLVLGSNNVIKDFKFESSQGNVRINEMPGLRFDSKTNIEIEGVWVANTFGAGIIGVNVSNVTIRNCRVFGTFADAIHLARNTHSCLVENNLVRNSGDDGLAFVAYNSTDNYDIIFRNNSVWFNYWGRGITLIGSDNGIVEKNIVTDGVAAGMMVGTNTYSNQATPFVTNFLVQHNRIVRCGNILNQTQGALWVWGNVSTSPMSGHIRYNEIIDPTRHGITVINWVPNTVFIQYNSISEPGPNGQKIYTNLASGFNPTISDNYHLNIGNLTPESEKLKVSPNPVYDYTMLSWDNPMLSPFQVYIYDMEGRLVKKLQNIQQDNFMLDFSEFKSGVYFLEVIGKKRFRSRLVKI